jgi:hypothetical protein
MIRDQPYFVSRRGLTFFHLNKVKDETSLFNPVIK